MMRNKMCLSVLVFLLVLAGYTLSHVQVKGHSALLRRGTVVKDMTALSRSDQGILLALTYPASVPLSRFRQQNFGVVITNTTNYPLSFFVHQELLLIGLFDARGRPVYTLGGADKPMALTDKDLVTLGPHGKTTRLLQFDRPALVALRPGTYTLHAVLLDIPSVWPKDIIRRMKQGQLRMWKGSQVQTPNAKIQIVKAIS